MSTHDLSQLSYIEIISFDGDESVLKDMVIYCFAYHIERCLFAIGGNKSQISNIK